MRRLLTVLFAVTVLMSLAPVGSAAAADCGDYEIRFEAEGPFGGPLAGPMVMRRVGSGTSYFGEASAVLIPPNLSETTFDLPDLGSFMSSNATVFSNTSDPNVINTKTVGEVTGGTGAFEGATGSLTIRATQQILEDGIFISGRIGVELCFGE